jgi:hypothetical protein
MVVVFLSLSMVELDDGGGFVGLLGRVCDFTAYFMWRLKFFFFIDVSVRVSLRAS